MCQDLSASLKGRFLSHISFELHGLRNTVFVELFVEKTIELNGVKILLIFIVILIVDVLVILLYIFQFCGVGGRVDAEKVST